MRTKEQIEAGEALQAAIQGMLNAYANPDLPQTFASNDFLVLAAVDVLEEIPDDGDHPSPVRTFYGKHGLPRWKVLGLAAELDAILDEG